MSENGEIYTAGKKFYTPAGTDGMDKFHLCPTSCLWNYVLILVKRQIFSAAVKMPEVSQVGGFPIYQFPAGLRRAAFQNRVWPGCPLRPRNPLVIAFAGGELGRGWEFGDLGACGWSVPAPIKGKNSSPLPLEPFKLQPLKRWLCPCCFC